LHPKLKKKSINHIFIFFIIVFRNCFYESDIYSAGKILELLFDGWSESGLSGGDIASKERCEKWKELQKKMVEEVYLFIIILYVYIYLSIYLYIYVYYIFNIKKYTVIC
jgi:hypothetical protein